MSRIRYLAACSLLAIGCAAPEDGGGSTSQGGAPAAGAANASGGSSTTNTGGATASGGTSSGGSRATGGSTATGGDANGGSGNQAGVVVSVSPAASAVHVGNSLQLTATVTGASDTSVTWSVTETSGCGSVSSSGNYTAPASVPDPAYCHVKATSSADSQRSATATLNITSSVSSGQPGVWENVTPAGVSLDPNYVPATNFGVMDVVADPVRPSDLYVGICYQGFWQSTDYGLTWKKVSTGTNGSVLATGRPWTAAIDNDTTRDPSTPPTLYTANGYGSQAGVFKSTDGGVNWTLYYAGHDIYSLEMDPYDNQHLVTGMHEGPGLAETTDGGVTWKSIDTGSMGKSLYPHFIDTGSAATTRKTWLVVPQIDSGTAAMTTDGGATFGAAGSFSHPHGGNQAFNAGGGSAYVGASGGVWHTSNGGGSWAAIAGSTDHGYANGVVGTPSTLYTWDDGANAGGIGSAHFLKAPRDPGTSWTLMTAPSAMNNGGKTVAVTYDGTHYILVSGSWNAGIWRYVEP